MKEDNEEPRLKASREEYSKRLIETFVPKGVKYEYLTKNFDQRSHKKDSKRSELPSPTPLKFSRAERFDG